MAGNVKVVKAGAVLFKAGDAADGMYLVRKGELCVYLEQNGSEVKLANVGAGNMIGEMAFFDKKPRSASVKASEDCEITIITNADFNKLLKQIPKRFVSLMVCLSTRLRDTNTRLQKLEAGGTGKPYENALKVLEVISLLWYKEAEKDGKDWNLNLKIVNNCIKTIFEMPEGDAKRFIDGLSKAEVFLKKEDQYKNEVLSLKNRGEMSRVTNFIREFLSANPKLQCLPQTAMMMLTIIKDLAAGSAYDTVTITYEDVVAVGERDSLDTSDWQAALANFKQKSDALTLVKVSNGIGFRVQRKEFARFLKLHECLVALSEAGVAN